MARIKFMLTNMYKTALICSFVLLISLLIIHIISRVYNHWHPLEKKYIVYNKFPCNWTSAHIMYFRLYYSLPGLPGIMLTCCPKKNKQNRTHRYYRSIYLHTDLNVCFLTQRVPYSPHCPLVHPVLHLFSSEKRQIQLFYYRFNKDILIRRSCVRKLSSI